MLVHGSKAYGDKNDQVYPDDLSTRPITRPTSAVSILNHNVHTAFMLAFSPLIFFCLLLNSKKILKFLQALCLHFISYYVIIISSYNLSCILL